MKKTKIEFARSADSGKIRSETTKNYFFQEDCHVRGNGAYSADSGSNRLIFSRERRLLGRQRQRGKIKNQGTAITRPMAARLRHWNPKRLKTKKNRKNL